MCIPLDVDATLASLEFLLVLVWSVSVQHNVNYVRALHPHAKKEHIPRKQSHNLCDLWGIGGT